MGNEFKVILEEDEKGSGSIQEQGMCGIWR